MHGGKRRSVAILTVVCAVLFTFHIGSSQAAPCRLDWNGDYQIALDDYNDESQMGGFYAEWYLFWYTPYYPVFFPGADSSRLDYNGDGLIDTDDLMGTLDAAAETEGFYTEWYIFMYTPYYPVFFPEYDICPPCEEGICDEIPPLEWPPAYPQQKLYGYTWSGDSAAFATRSYSHLIPWNWLDSVWDPNIGDTDDTAKQTDQMLEPHREAMAAMPDGHKVMGTITIDRAMFRYDLAIFDFQDFCIDPVTEEETIYPCIWWDKGVERAKAQMDDFLRKYQQDGGELDMFVIDNETYDDYRSFVLRKGGRKGHEGLFDTAGWCNAIQNDPRWGTEDRYGYIVSEMLGTDDLYNTLCRYNSIDPQADHLWRWHVIRERMNRYVDEAIFQVVNKYFPNAEASAWGYHYFSEEYPIPHRNLAIQPSETSTGTHFGTHQVPGNGLYGKVHEDLAATPFNAILNNANFIRSVVLSNPSVPADAWLDFSRNQLWPMGHIDLFKENVFHTALAGAEHLLVWNPYRWRPCDEGQQPTEENPCQLYEDWADIESDRFLEEALAELSEAIGYQVNKQTVVSNLVTYTDRYLLTGLAVGDYRVWRFTPEPSNSQPIEDLILQNDSDLVLSVTIAQGPAQLIIPEATVWQSTYAARSNHGLWIIQNNVSEWPRVE